MWKHRGYLEGANDPLFGNLIRREPRDVLTIIKDCACRRSIKLCKKVEASRFPRAIWTY